MANNETQDEGFDCRFAKGKSYGSHQFLNWWQQLSPGQLHLDGFESQSMANKKRHPNGWRFLLAEDEGFEPPQTESESGVLPLHKSSIWNIFIICKISKKSSIIFQFFKFSFSAIFLSTNSSVFLTSTSGLRYCS